ncbi:hypothetical protein AGLY_001356 [Aphis glycines]|uniref:FLYWCH-type domain-containing protein n=1 Tax=Aphis glycines TaxID=307491 RepID=A0A6G0U5E6_APHGL|nr:hypothetical protein AGLY_001356 [Aphis glycines]
MSKVKSKRNKNVIPVDSFMYVIDKLRADQTKRFWRCRRKDLSCPARIHTAARIEADTALTSMRQRAVLKIEHTSCVINEYVNGLSDAAKGVLQSFEALKRQVRRIRNNKIAISDVYKNYSLSIGINEIFLLADSGPSNERILIFGRPLGLELLKDSKIWYMDGTFKVAPTPFSQVYVILAEFLRGVHPAIYALPPNKKEQCRFIYLLFKVTVIVQ